jgi:UDP-N-acetylmuramoyl-L-alanyl-D-glutamate--2,6-diaminopimelate ligase
VARIFGYYLAHGGDALPDLPSGVMRSSITRSDLTGQSFRADGCGIGREFRTPLVGRHNVENTLGAILAARALGIAADAIAGAVAGFPGVPGRLERLESASGATAFVDFAHTDDALRSVLSVLRPLVKGRLITVFGCGGDRDAGKRPLMARAAEESSDRVVVTSDNPRTEDPERIIDAVMSGFVKPDLVVREADRPAAVRIAVRMAGPEDAVLVAGKGHEDYQLVGTEKRRMDDRELVRDAFAASGQ